MSKRPVERESGFDTSTLLSTGKLSLRGFSQSLDNLSFFIGHYFYKSL
ncbi:hypothetical protein KC799_24425 [candidate division KSB1 bacterium]|nr:hypothetical protein [candidate division KSB1 bacterium]